MSTSKQMPPPRSPFRSIANSRAEATSSNSDTTLTALPSNKRLNASEKLAARRISSGSSSRTGAGSRPGSGTSSRDPAKAGLISPASPSSLSRRTAMSRRTTSDSEGSSSTASPVPSARSPSFRQQDLAEQADRHFMRRSGSATSSNPVSSSPSEAGTNEIEIDTDATSDVEGIPSSQIPFKVGASGENASRSYHQKQRRPSEKPLAGRGTVETPRQSPPLAPTAGPSHTGAAGTGLGIFNLPKEEDPFASVKGLMADLGDTIGDNDLESSPELNHGYFAEGSRISRPAHSFATAHSLEDEISSEAAAVEQREARTAKAIQCGSPADVPTPAADAEDAAPKLGDPDLAANAVDSTPGPTPEKQKRGVWGFLRSQNGSMDTASASPVPNDEQVKAAASQQATPVPPQSSTLSIPATVRRQPTLSKLSQQLSGLAAGLKVQMTRQDQTEADPADDELRVRLPRREVDEDKLAELMIKCAEAKHVLRTDSRAEKLREVGLRLEEGWKEQLAEAQSLRSRLEITQDTVEDLEDENKQLRTQLGTLSELLVLREDELKLLQQASIDQRERERALWEEEAKHAKTEDEYQLARVRRLLAEERSLSAHLEFLLASAVQMEDNMTPEQPDLESGQMVNNASLANEDDNEARDSLPRSLSGSSNSGFGLGANTYQSMPSFEIHDTDDGQASMTQAEPGERLTRRVSTRSSKSGTTEIEVLFHIPHSPTSSRPATTLFNNPPAIGQSSKFGLLSPLLSPSFRKKGEARAEAAPRQHAAEVVSRCPAHRVRVTSESMEGVPDSVSKLPLLEHKVVMVFGNDVAVLTGIVDGLIDRGATAIAVACPTKRCSDSVFASSRAQDKQVGQLSIQVDYRSRGSIDSAYAACTAAFDGLECVINAFYTQPFTPIPASTADLEDGDIPDCTAKEMLSHLPAFLEAQTVSMRALSRQRRSEMDALDVDDTRATAASSMYGASILNVVFEEAVVKHASPSRNSADAMFGAMYNQATFGLTREMAIRNDADEVRINAMQVGDASQGKAAATQAQTIAYLLSDLSEFVNGAVWTASATRGPTTDRERLDYTCTGPPLCASEKLRDPSRPAESRAALIRARLEAAKAVSDEEVLRTTRDENDLLQRRSKQQEERIQELECELHEIRERLQKTEEAVSGLF